MDDFSPNPCGWLYFWSEIASTNIATLAELPARVRVPRGKIYSPFTGQMLSRGVQTSGWRERERERERSWWRGGGTIVLRVAKYTYPSIVL